MKAHASSVVEFVNGLDVAFVDVVGDRLAATLLHGSAALGGFVPGRSDVDVLFITCDDLIDDRTLEDVATALRSAAAPCPGCGVEMSVVSESAALRAAPPWSFLLHLSTDPADDKVIYGAGHRGDPDLLMHYVVCRVAGVVVRGPPPNELIGDVDRREVLAYLEGELCWALEHASEAYAVLNACRAGQYLERGEIVSKVDGAHYQLERGGPQDLITAALAMQSGDQPHRRPSTTARSFIDQIRNDLHAAST